MTYAKSPEPGTIKIYEVDEYDLRLGWIKASEPLATLGEARTFQRDLKTRKPEIKSRITRTQTTVEILYSDFVQYLKAGK